MAAELNRTTIPGDCARPQSSAGQNKNKSLVVKQYVPTTLVLLGCVALGKPDGSVTQTSFKVEHDPDSNNGISGKWGFIVHHLQD